MEPKFKFRHVGPLAGQQNLLRDGTRTAWFSNPRTTAGEQGAVCSKNQGGL